MQYISETGMRFQAHLVLCMYIEIRFSVFKTISQDVPAHFKTLQDAVRTVHSSTLPDMK